MKNLIITCPTDLNHIEASHCALAQGGANGLVAALIAGALIVALAWAL